MKPTVPASPYRLLMHMIVTHEGNLGVLSPTHTAMPRAMYVV